MVPVDDRLPLSGQTISGFLDINPDKSSLPTDNHVRFSSHYGKYQRVLAGGRPSARASVRAPAR